MDNNWQEFICEVKQHTLEELNLVFLRSLADQLMIVDLPAAQDDLAALLCSKSRHINLEDRLLRVADIKRNIDQYTLLYDLLADDASRAVLLNLLNYYLYGRISFLAKTYTPLHNGYYFSPDWCNPPPGSVYVDCGSLDGLNVVEYATFYPDFARIYAYEPMAEWAEKIRALGRELGIHDLVVQESAVGDYTGSVSFASAVPGSSKVSSGGTGDRIVRIASLDADISEKIDVVKMDIEGYESEAIQGMRQHIMQETPYLAICVYHKSGDIWRLQRQVLELNGSYTFYLRHYRPFSLNESVLFCVPAHYDRPAPGSVLMRRTLETLYAKHRKTITNGLVWKTAESELFIRFLRQSGLFGLTHRQAS